MAMSEETKRKVLIVEDDSHVVKLLRLYLGRDGYEVLSARDGIRGLQLAREEQPDLVVLDLMLPKLDGMSVCRILREESDVPIVMLTARAEIPQRLEGLDTGADDYVTKPFSPRELAARVRAVLRRTAREKAEVGPSTLTSNGLKVSLLSRKVWVEGSEVSVTPTEFRILATFLKEPGRTFTRDQIIDRVFGYDFDGFDRTIDVHISNLRKRISAGRRGKGQGHIQTVYGVGYRFGDG